MSPAPKLAVFAQLDSTPPYWSWAIVLLMGASAGFIIVWMITRHTRRVAEEQAEQLKEVAHREALVEAQALKQKTDAELAAKQIEIERELDRKEIELGVKLRELRSREESVALSEHQLAQQSARIAREGTAIAQAREAIRALSQTLRKQLKNAPKIDAEAVRAALRQEVEIECQDELRALRRQILERSEQDLHNEAKRILITAMQRMASQPNNDVAATIVQLPNEDMKGRIIGREGRNIKSFEAATGVTLLIDESPQMALISSFDPVRREIARIALEALVKDGRIHPASIEDFVAQAKEDVDFNLQQAGEDAVQKLGINGLHPEIIRLLGKLKYRFSYTQNVLDHSVEVGFLASMIASELGLDPGIAKRAGLLHDVGKAIEGDYEGSHAAIGADFLRRYGETVIVVNAVAAHHEEVDPETVYAGLVILADTISATRPGARAESMAGYIQRLARLEKVALEVPGVQQAYAIQAGREVRVVVNPLEVTDEQAGHIAQTIRQRIEDALQYPSTIKVTVIREIRFTETAT